MDNSSLPDSVTFPTMGNVTNSREVDRYVSDATVQMFVTVNIVFICTGLSIFGIAANTINILVFARQGFQDTINITLFAMSLSDVASLITLLWSALCANPLFQEADIPFLSAEIQHISGGWPHVLFCRITGWLTAFVTVERCLCVLLPLKIKNILTPKLVKIIVVAIFLLVTISMGPIFYSTNLVWRFVPERNKTMIGVAYTNNRAELMKFSGLLSGVVSSLGFSSVVVISTVILIVKLKEKTKWRQNNIVNKEQGQQAGSRDNKIIKMIIIIATIFIICLLPPSIANIPISLDTNFNLRGKYFNIVMVFLSFGNISEAINSSVNIFVYYKMSSKYRADFRLIFCQ